MKLFAAEAALVAVLLLAAQFPLGLTLPSTAPAILWSPHQDGFPNNQEAVNYQTLSPKDLAKSVMTEGGWSNLLLQSLDISGRKDADPTLVDLLKVSFTGSNFSLAYPHVAASEGKEAIEHSLISEFAETCGHDLGDGNIAFLESCPVESEHFEKLSDFHSVNVNS